MSMRSVVNNVLKEGLNLTAMLTLDVYSSEAMLTSEARSWNQMLKGPVPKWQRKD